MRAPFLRYVETAPAYLNFLATGIALLTIALHTASSNQHHKQERMSSNNKQDEPKTPRTPFEMVADEPDQEHPIDLLVASRLPQTKLLASMRATVDELLITLGEDRSLWIELERQLNERHGARSEEYFNLGYEYGLAAGRAQALETNATPDMKQLAERLGALVRNEALPAHAIVAVLLEVAWAMTHEIAEPTMSIES